MTRQAVKDIPVNNGQDYSRAKGVFELGQKAPKVDRLPHLSCDILYPQVPPGLDVGGGLVQPQVDTVPLTKRVTKQISYPLQALPGFFSANDTGPTVYFSGSGEPTHIMCIFSGTSPSLALVLALPVALLLGLAGVLSLTLVLSLALVLSRSLSQALILSLSLSLALVLELSLALVLALALALALVLAPPMVLALLLALSLVLALSLLLALAKCILSLSPPSRCPLSWGLSNIGGGWSNSQSLPASST